MSKSDADNSAASSGDKTPVKTPKIKPGKQLAKPKCSGWDDDALAGLTANDRAECEVKRERIYARPKRACVSLKRNGDAKELMVGSLDKDDGVLQSIRAYDALGSGSNQFVDDALRRVARIMRMHGDDREDSNIIAAGLALVAAVEPQNELEATMALQMVAANEAAMMSFERSRTAEYLEHASTYSNMANKAMRSFALHAEAIAKLRRGGEQVVRHVHVNEGGQAVIAGTVNTGGQA